MVALLMVAVGRLGKVKMPRKEGFPFVCRGCWKGSAGSRHQNHIKRVEVQNVSQKQVRTNTEGIRGTGYPSTGSTFSDIRYV